ncbi:M23 family metallopeptidase [Paenibacillus arenilitoris]|uniref:M23 family metallopeptidase n=1 Tax=Paenibacillus arenilitoris TaxID=2772299 RepID=A0A927CR79_9BACL|nr:M23 family metallopeptidase [Paenibacillus arenilitoris]MBD2870446.1 M23 family metallopeptidase [Paenibacillus arenilitoris]
MHNRNEMNRHREDELDPEDAWKANPNPWARWDEAHDAFRKSSFVKGQGEAGHSPPVVKRSKHSFRNQFLWKLAIASLLFAGIWAMFRQDSEWAMQGRAIVTQALEDEIDFAAAAAWYKDHFAGAPSFIPIFRNDPGPAVGADGTVKLPVVAPLANGVLVRTFAELLDGVELAGASEAEVVAVETGRVLVLSEQANGGSTVVVQHANGRVTVYGKLAQTEVQENDWVEAGDPIGRLPKADGAEPSLLYFAVKQNDKYIDPAGVIPLD